MDIKRITITNYFQNILDESNDRPNKIWQIKAGNFIIDQKNSAFNEGKYVITERFIRTLKDHSATEMKPVDVKSLTLVKKLMIKILSLKLAIM